jgi:large subunit ribosomal protein L9
MQVILLEKVERLGSIGQIVDVKNGYARNFLFPRKKAIRATEANVKVVELRKAELEAENAAKKAAAEKMVAKINGLMVNLIRQAGEDGRLYGSVTARDIANAIAQTGKAEVAYDMIVLNSKFKELGIYPVDVMLHSEVKAVISLNIARSEEEAKVAKENLGKEKKKSEKKEEAKVEAVAESEEEKPKTKKSSKAKSEEGSEEKPKKVKKKA